MEVNKNYLQQQQQQKQTNVSGKDRKSLMYAEGVICAKFYNILFVWFLFNCETICKIISMLWRLEPKQRVMKLSEAT